MKGKLLAFVASMVSSAASMSVKPLCFFFFHQPKVPSQLINK